MEVPSTDCVTETDLRNISEWEMTLSCVGCASDPSMPMSFGYLEGTIGGRIVRS